MNTIAILWPTFALVALVFGVWFTLFVQRTRHMKRNPPSGRDFTTGEAALNYFRPVEMPANNLANLFEMPVLYFALVPLLMITHHAGHVQVVLAWVFVVARAVHSFIQIVTKRVLQRFLAYLVSCIALVAMWIGFFVDMLTAASALSDT